MRTTHLFLLTVFIFVPAVYAGGPDDDGPATQMSQTEIRRRIARRTRGRKARNMSASGRAQSAHQAQQGGWRRRDRRYRKIKRHHKLIAAARSRAEEEAEDLPQAEDEEQERQRHEVFRMNRDLDRDLTQNPNRFREAMENDFMESFGLTREQFQTYLETYPETWSDHKKKLIQQMYNQNARAVTTGRHHEPDFFIPNSLAHERNLQELGFWSPEQEGEERVEEL